MTKKFISLLISVIMVVGLIPVMSVSAESTVVTHFNDDFETWNPGIAFNEKFEWTSTLNYVKSDGTTTTSKKPYNIMMAKNLSLKIIEIPGYDGEETNAAEITINSCAKSSSASANKTPGSLRLLGSNVYATSDGGKVDVYVQEMDVYITDNPNTEEFFMDPIYIEGNKIGFGSGKDNHTGEDTSLTPGWHRVKAITFINETENNIIGYLDGKLVTYKNRTTAKAAKFFQLDTFEKGYKTIIFDNIKLWGNPDATTVSSVYSDASDVSKTVSPVVTFSQSVLDCKTHSDGIGLEDVELIATSGATIPVDISLSNDGKTLTIDPKGDLNYGTQYTVKLTGLVDMYGQAIADTQFTFTTMEESKISCAQPTFKKENLFVYGNQGTTITALENGYIRTDLTVSNTDASEKEVFVIALLKENGDIKGFQFDNVTVPASGSVDFNCSFQVDDAANQTIETFVWDSFSGKSPLASKWTFSNSGCTETTIEEQ